MAVYLIHFDTPYKHAKHYAGYSSRKDVTKRLDEHKANQGANLMKVVNNAGISWHVSRIWKDGTRAKEKQIKQNGKSRYCPDCKAQSKAGENA